ncbi:MAG: hypothetical protein R3C25_03330 [Hyphomonadaceae bacterium]
MDAEIFVPFVFFSFLAAIILVPTMVRERTKRSAHDLISQALSRGQQLDASLVSQLSQNMLEEGDRARKSLGHGVILLALAAGFVGAGYVAGGWDADAQQGMMIPAVILGAVGFAFLLLAVVDYMTRKRSA